MKGKVITAKCITDDGIDHGSHILEDCLNGVIERYEDGYVLCGILRSGGSCEECMEIFEQWQERYG